MKHGLRIAAFVLLAALFAPGGAQAQGADAGKMMAEPRTHGLMRHAEAPGTGDPAGFRLGECSTQRNLSDEGRDQARDIGQAIRTQGIRIDRVFSSQWCRTAQTADLLGVAPVVELPSLNSFFDARDTSREQSQAVIRMLAELDGAGSRAILVTHQVNITALTGVFPASGEMILVRVAGNTVEVRGRVTLAR